MAKPPRHHLDFSTEQMIELVCALRYYRQSFGRRDPPELDHPLDRLELRVAVFARAGRSHEEAVEFCLAESAAARRPKLRLVSTEKEE